MIELLYFILFVILFFQIYFLVKKYNYTKFYITNENKYYEILVRYGDLSVEQIYMTQIEPFISEAGIQFSFDSSKKYKETAMRDTIHYFFELIGPNIEKELTDFYGSRQQIINNLVIIINLNRKIAELDAFIKEQNNKTSETGPDTQDLEKVYQMRDSSSNDIYGNLNF